MCKRATCPKCKQPTWKGCGAHVEQVLGDVPKSQRCQCNSKAGVVGSKRTTARKDTVSVGDAGEKRRWFRR